MRLYLDDDSAASLLTHLLRRAGHDVQIPADFSLSGADDPVHLRTAISNQRVFLSRNHDDFEQLHLLVLEAQGHHPGILNVRSDNNPKRDLKDRDVVRAITNLTAAGVSPNDQLIVLNHWK